MKPLRTLGLVSGLISSCLAAAANLECTGVMMTGSDVRVALVDKETGTSRWVGLNEAFRGYTFKAFDAAADTAILTKDGVESRLRLNAAKVQHGAGGTGKLTPETAKAIFHNLRQIAAAADQYYLEHGTLSTNVAELVGPTKNIRRLVVVDGEDYSNVTLKQGTPVKLTTAAGETIGVRDDDNIEGTYAFHTVQSGETGKAIAAKAKLSVTDLQKLNADVDFTRLKFGEVIRVK
jgi:hypothetical protein